MYGAGPLNDLWGALLIALQIVLAFITFGTGWVFILGSELALIASVLLALSMQDSPSDLASFAAIRYITAAITIVLMVVIGGYVVIPSAAFIALFVGLGAAIVAITKLFILVLSQLKLFRIRRKAFA